MVIISTVVAKIGLRICDVFAHRFKHRALEIRRIIKGRETNFLACSVSSSWLAVRPKATFSHPVKGVLAGSRVVVAVFFGPDKALDGSKPPRQDEEASEAEAAEQGVEWLEE